MKDKNFVAKGTCILAEEPFVYILRSSFIRERCDNCLKSGNVMKCGGCYYVHYCGTECQQTAWVDHKQECPHLKDLKDKTVPDAARIIAKIVRKLKNNGDLQRSYYSKHGSRKFRDLMSHYHEIKRDEKRMQHVEALSVVLQRLLPLGDLPNENELLTIYGRLVTNGFNILDSEMNSIATGIYLAVSIVDHSCTPTAVATFIGKKLYLRTLEDIPAFSWDKVFISYIDLLNTRDHRRQELKEGYYFLCTCSRCVNTEELALMTAACCPNKKCKAPVVINDEISECSSCHEVITAEFINKFQTVLSFTIEKFEEMKAMFYLDVLELCLRKQEEVFHTTCNIWHVKTLDSAFESAIQMQKWEDAVDYGTRMLPGYRKYNGHFHPFLGINLTKIGKIELLLDRPTSALQHLQEASTILKVTHGENHPYYKEQVRGLLNQAHATAQPHS